LGCIFQNIRIHTGKGYYRRHSEEAPEPSLGTLDWWGVVQPAKKIFTPDNTPLIALGDGFFAMDRDGEPFWGGNLPKEFTNKLRGRPRHLPRVDFVAFGPDDAYFVQFS
jgi:hypothetical protein